MSQRNKLSLWQKIKRLLTASAPQSVIDGTGEQADLSLADSNADHHANTANDKTDISTNVIAHSSETTDNNSSAATSEPDASQVREQINSSRLKPDHSVAETQRPSDTPIVDCLKQYFSDKQWHYTHYRPKTNDSQQSHHLSLRMRHKQVNCGYLFRVQEKNKLLAVYGILPFLIPESHQNAALLLITQINYDMLIGNLEMDINDGEIRYKNAIDVEAVGIDNDIIEHLLQSVVAMTTVANELFDNLINNQDPAEDMQTLLIELRQQSDARTFFLPTQFVQ